MSVRFNLEDLPVEYQKQVRNKIAVRAPHMEPNTRNEPLAKKEPARFTSPCSIHIHSIRKRLADADGISGKAVIDGLVHAKVIENDDPKRVTKVSYSQENGKSETIILIEEN